MITYLGKEYENLTELSKALKVPFSMASHLYQVNKNKGATPVPVETTEDAEVIDEILEDAEDGRLKKDTVKKVKDLKKKR